MTGCTCLYIQYTPDPINLEIYKLDANEVRLTYDKICDMVVHQNVSLEIDER